MTAVALTGRAAAVEAAHPLVGLGSLCRSDLDEVLQRRKFSPASREAAAADAALVRERFDNAGPPNWEHDHLDRIGQAAVNNN
ncbi:hypothetical protein [Streptomyces himalayensis]|uniref:Uncharacterized protein n=1 Tax=Streptomyces himalayensis subsp. himalayensis TaxID=2756131 RepID=A0A7W0DVI5_9ACTN|nr:hypothetical protein [Streptomyces himalayensis]MBA2952017.1 hypothetical protein [Streptomyces himalayensis subsp. himalayensis]